jgi:hypothetical protein
MSTEGGRLPETRDNMKKSILKQILDSATKSHFDCKEAKRISSSQQ